MPKKRYGATRKPSPLEATRNGFFAEIGVASVDAQTAARAMANELECWGWIARPKTHNTKQAAYVIYAALMRVGIVGNGGTIDGAYADQAARAAITGLLGAELLSRAGAKRACDEPRESPPIR